MANETKHQHDARTTRRYAAVEIRTREYLRCHEDAPTKNGELLAKCRHRTPKFPGLAERRSATLAQDLGSVG